MNLEIDGAAMEFTLAPVLANLFLGNSENILYAVKIPIHCHASKYLNVNATPSMNIVIQFKGLTPILLKI